MSCRVDHLIINTFGRYIVNLIAEVDFTSLAQAPAGSKVCKPQSAMLLSCIRRQLTLVCNQ
jgi:hypothetical protein